MFESEAVPLPIVVSALAFVAGCMLSDMATRRIPNVLSGTVALAGLVLNGVYFGSAGVVASLLGAAATMSPLVVPFLLGGIGGGDVKMMGAVGSLVGMRVGMNALAIGVVFGGVLMVVHLARRGRLVEKTLATGAMVSEAFAGRSLDALRLSADTPGAVSLPYSIPLGFGTAAALVCAGLR
jgi:prepilin peptidase CpaA